MKIIIHTERIVPNEEYLNDWFIEMEKRTDIPVSVLRRLKESGRSTWETKYGPNIVTTKYKIVEKKL
jgi:hypothetical protein